VRVVALDYGSARTGVAASDPSGTLARPVGVVERVRSKAGLQRLVEVIGAEQPEQIVVGLPLTLRGTRGAQARETERFVAELRAAVDVPIETFDERFTTSLANRSGGSAAAKDARAAAHLLSSWLEWQSARR
jgi:putative holliday junction resolvase